MGWRCSSSVCVKTDKLSTDDKTVFMQIGWNVVTGSHEEEAEEQRVDGGFASGPNVEH